MRSDHDVLSSAMGRVYVGGSYFNPVAILKASGRAVSGLPTPETSIMNLAERGQATYVISRLYQELRAAIIGDELLFALYRRGDILLAPFIWDEERLIDFEKQAQAGVLDLLGFYAVPRAVAESGLLQDFV